MNSIRFFESAARHLSFTKAGEELFVTQSAVSRQIRLLEEKLGCELFARNGPNLRLTAHGEAFQQTVVYSLDVIRQGVANLRRQSQSTLTVSVLPSFAANWLIPRIPQLDELEPPLSIRLQSSFDLIDFSLRTDIDVAIRLGRGVWPGLYTAQLTTDNMVPACSPQLAEQIHSIEDFREHTLLVDSTVYDEWVGWFKLAKVPYLAKDTRYYDDTLTQIRAALRGQGISLCREELIREYLQSGELVQLFDIDYISDMHYYFVCPEARIKEDTIKRFHDWLLLAR